jgi:hypothetical protein
MSDDRPLSLSADANPPHDDVRTSVRGFRKASRRASPGAARHEALLLHPTNAYFISRNTRIMEAHLWNEKPCQDG